MHNFPETYNDWRDFFTKRLVDAGAFCLSKSISKGNTDIEIYTAKQGNPETSIEVGYFSSKTLIYVNILNPRTPGLNRQQEAEYFYKHEFDDIKQYGSPGLEFEEINIRGINGYLEQGFNGLETVYYKNRRPVKSQLTTSYYPDSPKNTITYHFDTASVWQRLWKKIAGQEDKYDKIETIDLREVFSGLKCG